VRCCVLCDDDTYFRSHKLSFPPTVIRNKNHLLSRLRKLFLSFSSSDSSLFVLCSHGYSCTNRNRIHLELNGKSEFIRLRGERIYDFELLNVVHSLRSKSHLSLIDTCHSGTMLDLMYCMRNHSICRAKVPETKHGSGVSISACSDNETTGEDISDYGGWGGKLVGHFLDYLNMHDNPIFHPSLFYSYIYDTFSKQEDQRTHPVLCYEPSTLRGPV
jgi:hypothetical protein